MEKKYEIRQDVFIGKGNKQLVKITSHSTYIILHDWNTYIKTLKDL